MGVIQSSETFVTMYQSTDRQGPHILSQCSAITVRVLLYLKTVLVVVFSSQRKQTSYRADKLLIVCRSSADETAESVSTRTSSVRVLIPTPPKLKQSVGAKQNRTTLQGQLQMTTQQKF